MELRQPLCRQMIAQLMNGKVLEPIECRTIVSYHWEGVVHSGDIDFKSVSLQPVEAVAMPDGLIALVIYMPHDADITITSGTFRCSNNHTRQLRPNEVIKWTQFSR